MRKKNYFVEGLPINEIFKLVLTLTFIILAILNQALTNFGLINFGGAITSIFLFSFAILFSIGSKRSEIAVLTIPGLILVNGVYNLVIDADIKVTTNIIIFAIGVVITELIFGKVGLIHLFEIIKKSTGYD